MAYSDTSEQSAVINWKGRHLVVRAFAGTGKTSTLVRYALANPDRRMLYLAYNRAVRDEAERKFPFNVECKTSHQLAWANFGKHLQPRLTANLRITDIARKLNTRHWALARTALATVNHFLCSASSVINDKHLPEENDRDGVDADKILSAAQYLWSEMSRLDSTFPVTHDTYLKLFQLSDPDLSKRWDTILFDEAQDANPVTSSLVLSQNCNVILVGDRHQQIYRFRGADNALDAPAMEADCLWLTQSFRFGPAVAKMANVLLKRQEETHPVIGNGGDDEVVDLLPAGISHYTVLSRTVAGVIGTALLESIREKRIYWVSGIEGYKTEELEDLYWFSVDMPERMRTPRLSREYRDFEEFKSIAKATSDVEMNQAISLLDKYFPLPQKLQILRRQATTSEKNADVVVSTAHRSKGLEWDTVVLNEDFADITDPLLSDAERTDETNLLYVATTRARKLLVRNELLKLLCEPDEPAEVKPEDCGGSGDLSYIPFTDSEVTDGEIQALDE